MLKTRGYKTELDLNNKQMTACRKHAGAARYAYNWGLKRKQEIYEQTGKSISAMELHKELNALKATKIPWMYEVSKAAPQESLRDLDKACRNFFRTVKQKKGRKWGYPRFKSKKNGIGSFRLTGALHLFEDAIQLPRLGRLRLKECGYLPISGVKILSATVREQAGRWYVSLQAQEEQPEPIPALGAPIGIDLGVKTLATVSDGRIIPGPKALRSHLSKLRRANKRLHRRKKGSKNRKKAQKQVASVHARIAHIREDALHQATCHLTCIQETHEERYARKDSIRATFPEAKTKREGKWQEKQVKKEMRQARDETAPQRPSVIVIEDLNISGMLKNRHLARSVADVGMREFRRQIEYKAEWAGSTLLVASRWYPSSKMCSCCGWIDEDLTLADRIFVCQDCGLVMDRDLNASRNLELLAYLDDCALFALFSYNSA